MENPKSLDTMMVDWAVSMTRDQVQKLVESGIFSPVQMSNFIEIMLTIEGMLDEKARRAGVSAEAIAEAIAQAENSGQ